MHTIIQNHIEAHAIKDNIHESFQNNVMTAAVGAVCLVYAAVVFKYVYLGFRAQRAANNNANNIRQIADP